MAVCQLGLLMKITIAATIPISRNRTPLSLIQNGFDRSFIIFISRKAAKNAKKIPQLKLCASAPLRDFLQAQDRIRCTFGCAGLAERGDDFCEL